jgi:hypothetical protein
MEREENLRSYYAAYFETITIHQLEGKLAPIREVYGGFNVMWGKDFQLMDGGTFKGGISGDFYDKAIHLLLRVKEAEI